MSSENEDQHTPDQHAESNCEKKKKLQFSYSRDFLLSLKELDACKKLPCGFDQSILSEFEDTSQDRQKSFSLHGYRRNEYGSSPPTRGESGNYSRGIQGRWDSRSSGRSDKDSDSQSDLDSDSGRRYGNQSRRPWQVPEHDGLLGSGSFARPSGYAAGASAPKFRANDQYQIIKSNEPYHPPRPYKAVPHLRREITDSYNDETFGSSECTSEDKAEEERKRRASFELMRKEQQKEFQEKHKLNSDKRKFEFDISTLRDDSKDDEGISSRSKQFDELVPLPCTVKHSDKSLPAQAPASRPLVPPGFANAALERNHGTKAISHSRSLEVGNFDLEGGILHTKGTRMLNGTFDEQEESAEPIGLSSKLESMNVCVSANKKSDKLKILTSDPEVPNKMIGHDQMYKNSNLLTAFKASEGSEVLDLEAEKAMDNKIRGDCPVQSSSILDKLFSSAVTVDNADSSIVQQHEVVVDDTWGSHAVQSSKFARWFLEEENKPVDDISSGRPKDLLSLIVAGEKGGFQTSDVKAAGHVSCGLPSRSTELVGRRLESKITPPAVENSDHLLDASINKPPAVCAVLTCEDLEQSILSEISGGGQTLQPPVLPSSVANMKKNEIGDEHASQHLLSLLQKGMAIKDTLLSTGPDIISADEPHNLKVTSIQTGVNDCRDVKANVVNSGKSLTLEALFGTAFMKEVQSVGAPSSAQDASVRVNDSDFHDGLLPSKLDIGSGGTSYGSCSLSSNQIEQMKSDGMKEDNFKIYGDDQYLEEDSLIRLGDPTKHLRNSSKVEVLSSAAQADVSDKLVGLGSTFGDERPIIGGQDGSPFLRGSYDARERDVLFHNVHAHSSAPQLHHQWNHVNPQMNFMATENVVHHDPLPGHRLPVNMHRPPFLHPSMGLTGVDAPTHHHMLQQLHTSGSLPPPHLLRGFPSGPHSSNQIAGFGQDANPLQGLPFGNRPPNFVGIGVPRMPPPVPETESRTNNPEALQRLIGMELRSNPKQIHPLATTGPNQGMYNHEMDMGFGYRS